MFEREVMLSRVQDGDLDHMKRSNVGVFFARVEALMLMDAGPSDALDTHLAYSLEKATPTQRKDAEQFDAWVRAQAANA